MLLVASDGTSATQQVGTHTGLAARMVKRRASSIYLPEAWHGATSLQVAVSQLKPVRT